MKKKIIITLMVMIFIVLLPNTLADLTDAVAYYSFDDSENFTDIATGKYNLTNEGSTSAVGKLGGARKVDSGSVQDLNATTFNPDTELQSDFTFIGWINAETFNANGRVFGFDQDGASSIVFVTTQAGGQICFTYGGGEACATGLSTGVWYHVVATFQDSTNRMLLYINSTLKQNQSYSSTPDMKTGFMIGRKTNGQPADVFIDEIGVYNRSLTQTEITQLYNNDNALNPFDVPIALINITLPVNNSNHTTDFSVNAVITTSDNSNGNCSLYINNTINDTGIFLDGGTIILNTTGLNIGEYNFYLQCNTSTISNTNSTLYDFYVDINKPVCNFTNLTTMNGSTLETTFSCTDEHFYLINISCPNNNYSYYVSGLDTTNYLANISINKTIADVCTTDICDGHTGYELLKDWYINENESKDEIFINNKKAGEIWVDDGEIDYIRLKDRYEFEITFYNKIEPFHKIYYKTSGNSNYMGNDVYNGWVIDNIFRTWYDLENEYDEPVFVIDRGNGLFEYHIYTDKDVIAFNSFGELNCVQGSLEINVNYPDSVIKDYSQEDLTLAQTMFLFFIFVIGLVILIYSEIIKNVAMLFISGMFFLFFGLFMMPISSTFAIMILIVSILIMVRATELRLIMKR